MREGNNSRNPALFITVSKRGLDPKRISGISLDYMLQKYLKKALIKKKITVHDLRHTCFTLELMAGANIMQIQKQAGHSSIQTTQRYLHLIDDIRNSATDLNPLFSKTNIL